MSTSPPRSDGSSRNSGLDADSIAPAHGELEILAVLLWFHRAKRARARWVDVYQKGHITAPYHLVILPLRRC